VDARGVAARICIERQPNTSADMLLEDEDVVPTHRRHFWSWRGAREMQPVRGEIERWNNAAEQMKACTASAERPRAIRGTTADNASLSGERQRNKHYRSGQLSLAYHLIPHGVSDTSRDEAGTDRLCRDYRERYAPLCVFSGMNGRSRCAANRMSVVHIDLGRRY